MVERQHDSLDNHVQNLQQQAYSRRGESGPDLLTSRSHSIEPPEGKINFNNYEQLKDLLSQHPQEPPFKATLHFKDAQEFQEWVDQYPEWKEEKPKFGIWLKEPPIVRIPLRPLTPEEIDHVKEFFKRVRLDISDSEMDELSK